MPSDAIRSQQETLRAFEVGSEHITVNDSLAKPFADPQIQVCAVILG